MAKRDLPHIFVPQRPQSEPYTSPNRGRSVKALKLVVDRVAHGRRLSNEFKQAWEPPSATVVAEKKGAYITFESFPGLELALESLDSLRYGDQPELVAVREIASEKELILEATVYIPEGKKQYFLEKLNSYIEAAGKGEKKHQKLIEGIRSIRRATIRELWTDPDDQFPKEEAASMWWEVWLRNRDGEERQRFYQFSQAHGLKTSDHYLGFGDRTVVLIHASVEQLGTLFDAIDDIAELRKPHEISSFLPDLAASDQQEWVEELLTRVESAEDGAPVVCILDQGVQSTHPLLKSSLATADQHSADPSWNHDPVLFPHGTEMAGLALYGDLEAAIIGSHVVNLKHRLESVKLLPDKGINTPDVYGAITARAVDQPEITAPARNRVFMLAVTAQGETISAKDNSENNQQRHESGRPTAWSATIDALSYGRAIDDSAPEFTYLDRDEPRKPRLFVISAGNIRDIRAEDDPLDRSDAEAVEDPSQAWNALTVGAFSEKDDMAGAPSDFEGYIPIASRGELAPTSRTSVSFNRTRWPFKPDVVASGGNSARTPDKREVDFPPNLALLTTRLQKFSQGSFTTTRDTSAATARVASIAAGIYAAYPDMKPETVRALIVHSAEWTDVMRARFDPKESKENLGNLLRRYGMGVPSLDRAIHSASNALTLISESSIRPYERLKTNEARAREMNLHQFPWPIEQLNELGETTVNMRVTLSYFIEPNPSSRGWSGRYVYPSHGLRFATRRPEENVHSFRERINTRAREVGEKPDSLKTEKEWLLGANQQQSSGSLHTDIWTGSAAKLASKEAIAIYPVAGWWKHRGQFDQSDKGVDYSLIVSIEAPEVEIDLWTPVAQQIRTAIEI